MRAIARTDLVASNKPPALLVHSARITRTHSS